MIDAPFSGHVALVTGAGSGIGAATARMLAERGATVWFADRDLIAAERACAGVAGASPLALDVTDAGAWAETTRALVGWSILVNAAGISRARGDPAVDAVTIEDCRAVFAVNLEGTLLGCQHAMRSMAKSGGTIVNIASTAGRAPSQALGAYGASKAAVEQLTLSVAAACSLQRLPIRCNAVAPGMVDTAMTSSMQDDYRKSWASQIPLRRFAEPNEIAETICFLSMGASSYVTGSIVRVDGGLLSRPIVQ